MPVLVVAVITMSAAQLLDLATFGVMVQRIGVAAEANPLIAGLFALYGMPVVAIAKVTLLALVTSIVAMLASAPAERTRAAIIVVILVLAIGAGVVGGTSNAVAMGVLG